MKEQVSHHWWPFSFGASVEELENLTQQNRYSPWDTYLQNLKIKRALDAFKEGTFTHTESEDEALGNLYAKEI